VEVLILTIFISIALVAGELLFFAWNVHTGNHDHLERLTLLPLERDERREQPAAHDEGSV
jgi:cbb3-type cytochrome oxidase maturation protein